MAKNHHFDQQSMVLHLNQNNGSSRIHYTYRGALSTQWAAVITILSFIIDPPQKWNQSSLLKHM